MYNKNKFRKLNDKKILHKIGKHWVVLSVSMLGALGLSGTVSNHVHANSINSQSMQSSAHANFQSNHASLIESKAGSVASPSVVNNSQNTDTASMSGKVIDNQARALYQRIIQSAGRGISMHRATPYVGGNSSSFFTTPSEGSVNDKAVTGMWGTAPYSFDPKSGMLQTTSRGIITPIEDLGQNNNGQFKLQDIKDIKFAPGTKAPETPDSNPSDGSLFGAVMDTIQTTDGSSDGTALVSELCNLSDIDCRNLDTSSMTNMGGMFKNDTGLKHIQFGPSFDTSNVAEMSVMFYNDINLQSLDLSDFDTSNVKGITSMFESDYSLKSLDLGHKFNTRNVVYMSDVFHSDNSLESLDLGNQFYINNGYVIPPVSLSDMFSNDFNLKSLNLGPHFDTSFVNNMSDMFANDSDLTTLNLGSKFNTSEVPDMHDMFKGDVNLTTLNLGSDFDTTTASGEQYRGTDSSLYGGNIIINYNGAQDIFAGDNNLQTLIMKNARLVGPVNLPTSSDTVWEQTSDGNPVGSAVNLTNGHSYNGTYNLYYTDPIQKTQLNLIDQATKKLIKSVDVEGLKGSQIPFAVIDNALPYGYQPVIDFTDKYVRASFPNSTNQYVAGAINIPVEAITGFTKPQRDQLVAPTSAAPGHPAINWNSDSTPVSSKSSQSSSSTNMNSSTSSVSSKPSEASNQANQNGANSYSASASATSAAQSAASHDSSISEDRIKQSVSASISIANQQKASLAAKNADNKIRQSLVNSVSASVSIANQKLASQAASSADSEIDASIANSYAQSADQSIVNSYRNSVIDSVSVANQSKAVSAAQSADQRIVNSLKASVADSVAIDNQKIASNAASSADAKLRASISASIIASVSVANQSKASFAARQADQSIAASEQASVSNSISIVNDSLARSAAQSADQSIATSYSQSVSQSITSSYRASVIASISTANQQAVSLEIQEMDQMSHSMTDVNKHHSYINDDNDLKPESSDDQAQFSTTSSSINSSPIQSVDGLSPSASASSSVETNSEDSLITSNDYQSSSDSQSDQQGTMAVINLIFKDPKTGYTYSMPYPGIVGSPIEYSDAIDEYMFKHGNNGCVATLDPNDDQTLVRGKNEIIDVSNEPKNSSIPLHNRKRSNETSVKSYSASSRAQNTPAVSNVESSKATSANVNAKSQSDVINSESTSSVVTRSAENSLISQSTKASISNSAVPSRAIQPSIISQKSDNSVIVSLINNENTSLSSNASNIAPVQVSSSRSSIQPIHSEVINQSNEFGVTNRDEDSMNSVITEIPIKQKHFIIIRTCLAHNHMSSVGYIRDYSAVLRPHTVLTIEKAFKVQIGKHTYYRYEIELHHHHYFVTGNLLFVVNKSSYSRNNVATPVITKVPVKQNQFVVTQTCLAHNHINSVGYIEDYSDVLHPHTVLTIKKAFKVQVGTHTYYRYEISLHHRRYFITGNPLFIVSKYLRPQDVKSHRHLLITKACRDSMGRKLRRGKVVGIKRIIYVRRHGHLMTEVVLSNDSIITANREYVKLIK